MSYDLTELLNLQTTEKLRLIGALWDSIDSSATEPYQLTPQQQDEIRRRKAEMDAHPESCLEWSEIERYLDSQDG